MKISKSKGGTGVAKNSKTAGRDSTVNAADFRQLLQAQLGGVASVEATAPASQVADRPAIPAQLRLEGVKLAETTIDSLASLATALADNNIPATDLEAYIAALEEEGQGLVDLSAQLPQDDPLTKLIDQVATSCFLETAKYRRGDYL